MTQRSSLTGHHQPLLPLVQVRQHRLARNVSTKPASTVITTS